VAVREQPPVDAEDVVQRRGKRVLGGEAVFRQQQVRLERFRHGDAHRQVGIDGTGNEAPAVQVQDDFIFIGISGLYPCRLYADVDSLHCEARRLAAGIHGVFRRTGAQLFRGERGFLELAAEYVFPETGLRAYAHDASCQYLRYLRREQRLGIQRKAFQVFGCDGALGMHRVAQISAAEFIIIAQAIRAKPVRRIHGAAFRSGPSAT